MGRPPKTRNIFDMDEGLLVDCDGFAVDTSFVVEALLPDQKRHDVASRCINQMIERQATMYFCELIRVELLDCSIEIPLRPFQKHRYDKRVRRRALPTIAGLDGGWNRLRESLSHVQVCIDELWEMAGYMVDDYGLRSNDGYHAAAAFLAEVPILTFDTDFARVNDELTVYTSADLVPTCRRLRARRWS